MAQTTSSLARLLCDQGDLRAAAPLFAARGYEEIMRSQAPASVQASTEFTVLCPASSTCMHKTIN